MTPRPAARLLALLLLLAFGAGNGGVALLDAGMHHRDRATDHPVGAHLEAAGAPGCHAGRCSLGVTRAGGVLPGPAPEVASAAPTPESVLATTSPRPAHRLHAAARPRAPPRHSA
jgi:hypothetical protein